MSSSQARSSSENNILDTAPFLNPFGNDGDDRRRRTLRRQSLQEAARFLRRASSRRMMREPSMLVREAAAEELEERQTDWAYSKPVVVLDLLWNFAFVVVTTAVLGLSWSESPSKALRVWVVGYALQCVIHMICVFVEYRRRASLGSRDRLRSGSPRNAVQYVTLAHLSDESSSGVAKHLESANTMFSFIWWIIGFYWISAAGQELARESPQLYWLCVVFLAFDIFFIVFFLALACVIGIAVCCCLPCIIAVLYALADQEGASRDDLEQLATFKFRKSNDVEKLDAMQEPFAGVMTECGTNTPIEHTIVLEDAECCICLSAYDDGAELRELPCGHHFHCACVDKWLYINATCPLCKYNISRNSSYGVEEV